MSHNEWGEKRKKEEECNSQANESCIKRKSIHVRTIVRRRKINK